MFVVKHIESVAVGSYPGITFLINKCTYHATVADRIPVAKLISCIIESRKRL